MSVNTPFSSSTDFQNYTNEQQNSSAPSSGTKETKTNAEALMSLANFAAGSSLETSQTLLASMTPRIETSSEFSGSFTPHNIPATGSTSAAVSNLASTSSTVPTNQQNQLINAILDQICKILLSPDITELQTLISNQPNILTYTFSNGLTFTTFLLSNRLDEQQLLAKLKCIAQSPIGQKQMIYPKPGGILPISMAAYFGYANILAFLLQFHQIPTSLILLDSFGKNALMWAVESNSTDQIKSGCIHLLLEASILMLFQRNSQNQTIIQAVENKPGSQALEKILKEKWVENHSKISLIISEITSDWSRFRNESSSLIQATQEREKQSNQEVNHLKAMLNELNGVLKIKNTNIENLGNQLGAAQQEIMRLQSIVSTAYPTQGTLQTPSVPFSPYQTQPQSSFVSLNNQNSNIQMPNGVTQVMVPQMQQTLVSSPQLQLQNSKTSNKPASPGTVPMETGTQHGKRKLSAISGVQEGGELPRSNRPRIEPQLQGTPNPSSSSNSNTNFSTEANAHFASAANPNTGFAVSKNSNAPSSINQGYLSASPTQNFLPGFGGIQGNYPQQFPMQQQVPSFAPSPQSFMSGYMMPGAFASSMPMMIPNMPVINYQYQTSVQQQPTMSLNASTTPFAVAQTVQNFNNRI